MAIENSPKSAEKIASIDHLLSRILLLLPLKSLLRFKSVSKPWLALISSPEFCRLRLPYPNPAAGLLLQPASDHHPVDYSCNGLLLLRSKHGHHIYNPTTNSCSDILELGEKLGEIREMSLAFDPPESRYSVICVRSLGTDYSRFVIGIYSSGTRSWRPWGDPFPADVDFRKGVYWKGAVHWVSVTGGNSLCFKVADQVLDKMPVLPHRYIPIARAFSSDYLLIQSCGSLHFVEYVRAVIRFEVYEMRSDYSEWFVKYRVNLSPVVPRNREMDFGYVNPLGWFNWNFSVLSIVRGEREEDSFLVLQTPSKIIRYNLVCQTFENLYEFEEGVVVEGSLRYSCVGGFEYIESLCCV
ncbi:F-box family protein [Striga asiatica]|uniref:F-box family protein n=1 Tax=Striga asiatica TaxID=4170 RepID=A0A5A7QZG6_STRAF|nr:F-box family protein [Striga asiatica]